VKALLLALACLAGCAHGSDGARQAEATANGLIGVGYRAVTAHAHAESDAIVALASAGNPDDAQKRLDAERALTSKALQVLDVASDAVDVQDAAIGAAEVVKSKDYSAIIAKLIQAGLAVVDGLAVLGIKVQ
jgi:hypothetical protein